MQFRFYTDHLANFFIRVIAGISLGLGVIFLGLAVFMYKVEFSWDTDFLSIGVPGTLLGLTLRFVLFKLRIRHTCNQNGISIESWGSKKKISIDNISSYTTYRNRITLKQTSMAGGVAGVIAGKTLASLASDSWAMLVKCKDGTSLYIEGCLVSKPEPGKCRKLLEEYFRTHNIPQTSSESKSA